MEGIEARGHTPWAGARKGAYIPRVSSGAWLLVSWTLTFAAWLLVHLVALVRVLETKEVPERSKWWSLVPPVTPFVAWQHGIRAPAVLWMVLALAYVVLRWVEAFD